MLRYRLIDFSRGVAALLIAILHWNVFMIEADWGEHSSGDAMRPPVPGLLSPIYDHGSFAVQYFWMISGFVFAFVYGRSKIGFYEYAGRRVARLYPLHLLTLGIVAAFQAVLVLMIGTTLFYPENDLYHFILNLAFIPSWGLEGGPSFNGPVWSVAVEIPIYFLFWLCLRFLPMNAFTALAIAGVFFLLQNVIDFSHVEYCGMLFFIGAAIHYASAWFRPKPLAALASLIWALWLWVVLLVPAVGSLGTVLTVMAFGPLLAFFGALDRRWAERSGVIDHMAAFGDLSYSIYLLHLPLILLITIATIALGIDRDVLSGNLPAMAIYLLVTIWLSHLSLKWFETPARRWLRAVLRPAPAKKRALA